MADPARRARSFDELYEEVRRLPENLTGEILEPGVLRTISRPGGKHRFTSFRIRRSLGDFDLMGGGSGWWFEIEPEVRLGERLTVPDLAGWRTADEPDFVDENPIVVSPDWCCEILSPTTARDDRQLKLPLYAASGVAFTWLVDPALQIIEVFETRGGVPALVCVAKEDDAVVLPPFETRLEVGDCWKRPRS